MILLCGDCRADLALKGAKEVANRATDERVLSYPSDGLTDLPYEEEQSSKNSSQAETHTDISKSIVFDRVEENVEKISSPRSEILDGTFSNPSSIQDSFRKPDSPVSIERTSSQTALTSSSPVMAVTSWLGNRGSSTLSMASSLSASEFDWSTDLKVNPNGQSSTLSVPINPKLLLEVDDSGHAGGACSSAAAAIIDFIAIVLADIVSEHMKATLYIETILEAIPVYVDMEAAIVFQGLCLSRLINFLERRLIRDDEEEEKRLDKSRWSVNLDSLCSLIVDRVYMGAFPNPSGVLRILEFLFSMLQLANKDGRIEEAMPAGNVLLSITRGSKQLEGYVQALLKCTNRMIMYCFLPSFLVSIQELEFLSLLSYEMETKPRVSDVDICTILKLLMAHRHLIFCPSNLDTDLMCCLCKNLIPLLYDQRQNAKNYALEIIKHLLLNRQQAMEELLVSKANQGSSYLDIFHGGFDQLLNKGSVSLFFDWFYESEETIKKVLDQCVSINWAQYITGASKFPGIRIKGMESRRKKEMGRKLKDNSRLDSRHWEQMNERRYALDLVRESMSTELRVIRQDKYGWVLHAESEWHTHLLELVHERGIFPVEVSSLESEWQLCAIEGPYRMRKKFQRGKLKIEEIQKLLSNGLKTEYKEAVRETFAYEVEPFHGLNNEGTSVNEDVNVESPALNEWNDDQGSSVNDARSSFSSAQMGDSFASRSDVASPRQRVGDRTLDEKVERESHDNGEYLIRPFLEPTEKIRFKYNCERVMGLDKHDGIFLIGDFCLYIIENFYIDDSGCICEKECEADLSVIDQALGVKNDTTSIEFQLKSTSSWGSTVKTLVGGRAWAYSGGAWGKEKACRSSNISHSWHMWKLDSIHELLKRDYQLRPVAIEIFSMDGCNDLLVFHKREREEVFKNLMAMNLPRNSM